VSEKFTRNTLECTAWCAHCQDFTQHAVHGGIKGACLAPHKPSAAQLKKEQRHAEKRRKAELPRLFS